MHTQMNFSVMQVSLEHAVYIFSPYPDGGLRNGQVWNLLNYLQIPVIAIPFCHL